VSYVLILSNALTVKVNTKLIQMSAHFGSIGSTRNGTQRSTLKFGTTGKIQFSQQPSYLSFTISSFIIKAILLNFGNVQAVSNSIFITRSIRKPRPSI